MKETMGVDFELLRDTARPRTMIVAAQRQFYPTSR